jgi:hypothetical protein
LEIAIDGDVAKEGAGKGCRVARHADDAGAIAGVAEDARMRVRCANYAM